MANRWPVFLFVVVMLLNGMDTADAQGVEADFALANGLNEPRGVAVDEASRVLYVADTVNNRVLRYDSLDTLLATSAPTAVLGQLDFSGTSPNRGSSSPSQGSLDYPIDLWVDSASTLYG